MKIQPMREKETIETNDSTVVYTCTAIRAVTPSCWTCRVKSVLPRYKSKRWEQSPNEKHQMAKVAFPLVIWLS